MIAGYIKCYLEGLMHAFCFLVQFDGKMLHMQGECCSKCLHNQLDTLHPSGLLECLAVIILLLKSSQTVGCDVLPGILKSFSRCLKLNLLGSKGTYPSS